jgi:hypothetical protein
VNERSNVDLSGMTDVADELFTDEYGTWWVVKSEKAPTGEAAFKIVEDHEGEPDDERFCSLVRARIEWRAQGDGWWLTVDPAGPFLVWQVRE